MLPTKKRMLDESRNVESKNVGLRNVGRTSDELSVDAS